MRGIPNEDLADVWYPWWRFLSWKIFLVKISLVELYLLNTQT